MLIAAALVGLALMIVPNLIPKKSDEEEERAEITYYSETLEEKLEKLLSKAIGVGSAEVVVTLDRTGEYIYAKNESVGESSLATDYVIINGNDGEEAVLVSEIYPKVRGVAVVCTGGKNDEVRKRVTELVSAALGISANKIAVSG